MAENLPEPWLRGTPEGVHPLLAPVLFSFAQAKEDLARFTGELTGEQMWRRPGNTGAIGFHIRHIGGSVDRLLTYLEEREISAGQLAALKAEGEPGASRDELLTGLAAALADAEARLRAIDLSDPAAPRYVGRKRMPTSVIGLLVHIAEHTQRHVGQAVATARVVAAGL
ncbi:MAG TPA: DinB family protein [Solibacterales bacterium]|nr:DinB family protein [Bryobacterales bacterium]